MSLWYCSVCHSEFTSKEKPSVCDTCQSDERMIMDTQSIPQNLDAVRDAARTKMKGICAVYPACDGNFDKICQKEAYGKPIGLGGAGSGQSFRANGTALANVRFNMSVVGEPLFFSRDGS